MQFLLPNANLLPLSLITDQCTDCIQRYKDLNCNTNHLFSDNPIAYFDHQSKLSYVNVLYKSLARGKYKTLGQIEETG